MSQALALYGNDDARFLTFSNAVIGRNLFRLLPEDEFDRQPLIGGDGSLALVADLRLDNRDDLTRVLGGPELQAVSDAALFLKAYERWGLGVFGHLVGEYAVAIRDLQRDSLILARDPLGRRPLHYHHSGDRLAFSSMPQGLHALPEIHRRGDRARVAGFILDQPRGDGSGFFEEVERVRPGHYALITGKRIVLQRHWNPQPRMLKLRSDDDYIEAYRERLDEAVSCRLRGAGTLVGAQLSGGLDSGAVATTAARLMTPLGGRVAAFTAAPRRGFSGNVPRGRLADESTMAATTAALHGNVEHIVMRSSGRSPLDLFPLSFELFQEPATNLFNQVWWTEINAAARERGIRVMLNGATGNFSLTAGNLNILSDFVRRGHWLRWLREARRLAARGDVRWRGIFANSFGAGLPAPVWRLLCRLFLGHSSHADSSYLLRSPDLVRHLSKRQRAAFNNQPSWDTYRFRLRMIQQGDPGNFIKGTLAGWGIDERDATADTRLIEFSLSLPPEQLLRDGRTRALARTALSDRLPPAVLHSGLRGFQAADWYEGLRQERLRHEVERLSKSPEASQVIDMRELERLVDRLPTKGWDGADAIGDIGMSMMHVFSAGDFLARAAMPPPGRGERGEAAGFAPL